METIKTMLAISAFEKVAKLESFTLAAKDLGVSKAYVSKLVKGLEDDFGEKLILRSTRKIKLTVFGEELFAQCVGHIEAIDELKNGLMNKGKNPNGIFKISVAGAYGEDVITPVLAELAKRHDNLSIEIVFSSRNVDLVAENFDAAVRVGHLPDSSLFSRKIGMRKEYVCASKSYLSKNGVPLSPGELTQYNCILGASNYWTLIENDDFRRVKVLGNFRSNNGKSLLNAALAGVGIVKLPDIYVSKYIESGELIPLLEDYTLDEVPIWVLTHSRKNNSINLKAFWEILEEIFFLSE